MFDGRSEETVTQWPPDLSRASLCPCSGTMIPGFRGSCGGVGADGMRGGGAPGSFGLKYSPWSFVFCELPGSFGNFIFLQNKADFMPGDVISTGCLAKCGRRKRCRTAAGRGSARRKLRQRRSSEGTAWMKRTMQGVWRAAKPFFFSAKWMLTAREHSRPLSPETDL